MAWGNRDPKQPVSFDMKLMFAFHGVMMLLFLAGSVLTVPLELAIAGSVAGLIGLLSLHHRRRVGWRWPGVDGTGIFGAAGSLIFGGVMVFVAMQNLPVNKATLLPWFLAVGGITAFNLLHALNLVRTTETAFRADAQPPEHGFMSSARTDTSALIEGRSGGGWRAGIVRLYSALGMVLWLTFMGFMYVDQKNVHDGLAAPTAAADWPLTEHGRTVYIPAQQGQLIETLKRTVFIAFPSFFGLGFLLHFGLGVKIFSNLPTGRKDG